MSDAPERLWMFKDVLKPFLPGGGKINMGDTEYIRADLHNALRAENERLREIFQNMDDVIVARWELFISDQECLLNLRDRIRRALETKKAPGD